MKLLAMEGRMTSATRIEKRVAGTSGRYVGRIDGVDGEAELAFTVRDPLLISADHTEAPADRRGDSAGRAHDRLTPARGGSRLFRSVPTCSPSTGSIPSGATSW